MIISAFIFFQVLVHPFHVSVSEIKYKEDIKTIQISIRIFLDDLELALQSSSKNDALDITDKKNKEFISKYLKKYILERMKMWDKKGKEYELDYLGEEIEGDIMWCYLEIEKIKQLNWIKVKNTILHEVLNNQENIVHFRAYDKVQSAKLYRDEDTKIFEWE